MGADNTGVDGMVLQPAKPGGEAPGGMDPPRHRAAAGAVCCWRRQRIRDAMCHAPRAVTGSAGLVQVEHEVLCIAEATGLELWLRIT